VQNGDRQSTLEAGAALGAEITALVARDREKAERKAAQAAARAARAAARATARAIPPEPAPRFRHLTLEGVRAYRQLAAREEERVGYWQRVIAHRLEAVRGNGADVDVEHLRPGLRSQRLDIGREQVMAAGTTDLPPMPDLDAVWVDAEDQRAEALLATAAEGIAAYRTGLATQVQVATQELIARYRSAPNECLTALPA
jgi:hypothetical protein